MRHNSLKSKALHGSAWTLGGFGLSRVLRLANHLILARLLAPQIFGLMALVKVFMQGLGMFSDIGIKPSIIQNKRGNDPVFLNTAWTIQIIRGFSLWIVTLILTKPFAWWYAQSDPAAHQLVFLLPVASFSAVLAGFNSTALATLNKKLDLGRLTMITISTQAVSLFVMIVWALIHPTVWAMVAGGLASAAYQMIASHTLVPGYRVRLGWDRECKKELFHFGKWIFLSTAFTFLAENMDKLTLGKILSLEELGIYSIAFVFAKVALDVASRLGNTVLFPVYSKFQKDPERLMTVALKARDVVLWVGSSICICFAVGAPLFFETFWDVRYHLAGEFAQWLSVYIWARILMHTMDRIPLALGNAKANFFSNVIQTAGILTAIIGYFISGLSGFILGLSFGPIASHIFLTMFLPLKRLKILKQSLIFSIITGMVGLLFVELTFWFRTTGSKPAWIASVLACAAIPLVIAAFVAFRKIRMDDHNKSVQAGTFEKVTTQ